MLYEDEVVDAVVTHLRAEGWEIVSAARATQRGDDIVATRGVERIIIEAKGEGSSKSHSARFGSRFTKQQASKHVANAVLRALGVASKGSAIAAIALPGAEYHRDEIGRVWPALSRAEVEVFWVSPEGAVSKQS